MARVSFQIGFKVTIGSDPSNTSNKSKTVNVDMFEKGGMRPMALVSRDTQNPDNDGNELHSYRIQIATQISAQFGRPHDAFDYYEQFVEKDGTSQGFNLISFRNDEAGALHRATHDRVEWMKNELMKLLVEQFKENPTAAPSPSWDQGLARPAKPDLPR